MGTCLSKGKGKSANPKKPDANAEPNKATTTAKGTESAAGDKMICECLWGLSRRVAALFFFALVSSLSRFLVQLPLLGVRQRARRGRGSDRPESGG
jgi:hypothetical protein